MTPRTTSRALVVDGPSTTKEGGQWTIDRLERGGWVVGMRRGGWVVVVR